MRDFKRRSDNVELVLFPINRVTQILESPPVPYSLLNLNSTASKIYEYANTEKLSNQLKKELNLEISHLK